MADREPIRPPPSALRYVEGMRAALELGALAASGPMLYGAPRGDGHAVLVVPGMGGTDSSTAPLRRYLRDIGYESHGWDLGRNLGLRQAGGLDALLDRVRAIARAAGERSQPRTSTRKISVIGWSLGGVFARQMARAEPSMFRQVITMGSPINGDPRATAPWQVIQRSINNRAADRMGSGAARVDPAVVDGYVKRNGPAPPGIPATAIFSRSDGIVAWQIAMETPGPLTDNIEVFGSHLGLGTNPAVWHAIADRLSLPEGKFAHFNRAGWRQWMYGATGSAMAKPAR